MFFREGDGNIKEKLYEKAKRLAKIIEKQERIKIVTHCDADGIAGGAIAKKALDEIGIKNEIKVVKHLESLNEKEFSWIIDLNASTDGIITDHHYTTAFHENCLNPFQYGIDGEYEISGAGLAYLVALNMVGADDIANLAVIGAIGDLQDLKFCKLVSINRDILKKGSIEIKKDLRIYGRNKPLYKMIAYSNDPIIPLVFKKERKAIVMLKKMGIDYKKRWNNLSKEEKKKVFSELVRWLLDDGFNYDYIKRLFGEVYELNGTDLREYAALLNSVSKHGDWKIALKACLNEKFDIIRKKHNLKDYIEYAKREINEYENIYFFHGKNYILDTVVGTVAGIILKEEEICNPIVAFAESEEGIKVSVRAPPFLIDRGLNLSTAIKKATELVGGNGGGHKSAAGGMIPKGMEESFLQAFYNEIKVQLTL